MTVLTYEEWLKLPEVEGIEEVVNGEIQKMPPNKWNHARTVEQLAQLFRAQVDMEKTDVVTTVFGLVIRQQPLTTRVPDLAVFEKSRIEVLSPANTRPERESKLKDYETLGVPEVWVVSPEARTCEVLLLKDGRLETAAILRQGQLLPAHLPGVTIDIAAIWPK
jgi:Uma2 family endonuclease